MSDNREQLRHRIAAEIDRKRVAAREAWDDEPSSVELADAVLAVLPAPAPDPKPTAKFIAGIRHPVSNFDPTVPRDSVRVFHSDLRKTLDAYDRAVHESAEPMSATAPEPSGGWPRTPGTPDLLGELRASIAQRASAVRAVQEGQNR